MPGLSDSVTIGIVITLVFGALFFYLYSRLVQNEKRVSLIENILLDLKMSADSGWGQAGSGSGSSSGPAPADLENEGPTYETVDHVQPVSQPEPLEAEDVSNEEEMYKEILASASEPSGEAVKTFEVKQSTKSSQPQQQVQVTKVQPNYSAMTVKELKSLAKSRGVSFPSGAGRKELTDSLRKLDGNQGVEAGSPLGTMEGSSLDEDETLGSL